METGLVGYRDYGVGRIPGLPRDAGRGIVSPTHGFLTFASGYAADFRWDRTGPGAVVSAIAVAVHDSTSDCGLQSNHVSATVVRQRSSRTVAGTAEYPCNSRREYSGTGQSETL